MENAIYTIASHYGREYKLLLADTFSLIVDCDYGKNRSLAESIYFRDANIFKHLKEYCYISAKHFTVNVDIDIDTIYQELINDRLILAHVDTYFCSHIEQYHRYHMPHSLLVFKIDDEFVYIIDPNIGPNTYALSKNEFELAIREVNFFYLEDNEDLDYYSILNKSINKLQTERLYASILLLREMITNTQLILNEFNNYDSDLYQIVPFVLRISQIGGRRNLYAMFLEYIQEKTGISELNEIVNELRYSASKWYLWRSMILKSAFSQTFNKSRIEKLQAIIEEIKEIEQKCILDLFHIDYEKKHNILRDSHIIKTLTNKYIYVDLHEHFNNKGCSHNIDINNDFTLRGQYFCDKKIPSNQEININGMCFKFPNIRKSYDNITCDGQQIIIPDDHFNEIFILGCSENGSFFDYLKLESASAEPLKVKMGFTTWISDIPYFDDCKILSFNVYDKYKKEYLKKEANIFAIKQNINNKHIYNKLILPKCENIHIFSITFGG